jgi:stage III sporulation protein AF
MILPEGNCKKYIKVVIGIYVLFTIVSPVITKFSGKEIKVSEILDLNEYIQEVEASSKMQESVESENAGNITNIYINGIKEDMKAKIEAKGYVINNIELQIGNYDTYEIAEVKIDIVTNKNSYQENDSNKTNEVEQVQQVEKVKVDILNNEIEEEKQEEQESSRNQENKLNITQKQEIKEYLSSTYGISMNNISIN